MTKVEEFKQEVSLLMVKHELSISHEDQHGSFIIGDYDASLVDWFLGAVDEAS